MMNSTNLGRQWSFRWESLEASQCDVPKCPGWLPAQVPGDVHSDLVAAGLLEEPLKGDNALRHRWVEWARFLFRRTFSPPSLAIFDRAELVFEGLDLTAEVRIDGEVCGGHANAFRPLQLEVTRFLREDREHTLEVQLDSGLAAARGKPLGDYRDICRPPNPERLFLRKPQFSFGWDWAPRLVTCGIWRPVHLRLIRRACLRDVHLRSRLEGSTAHILVSAEVENVGHTRLPVSVRVSLSRRGIVHSESITAEVPPGSNVLNLPLVIPEAELWWPRPLGEPALYEAEVTLSVEDEAVDAKSLQYGIREVSLAQRPLEEGGSDFVFYVNGESVYCKGANWVPADSLPGRIPEEKYRRLLQLAGHTEFNMLRVWGGGIYEAPLFYSLCDQLGILVWQDFMLACAEYPDDDPAFTAEFEAEARHVIRRLRNHACLALWCGDNECDWIFDRLLQATPGEASPERRGRRLTHELLPCLVTDLDPSRAYWPSSPSSPEEKLDPNSPQCGDRHAWEVSIADPDKSQRVEFARYRGDLSRFASEYGFQAPPVRASLEEYLPSDQQRPGSELYEFHNNSAFPENVPLALKRFFREEPADLDEYLLKAQVVQAEALRTAIEHHRSRKWLCGGSLFWMYSDCWGTSGWTIIDYYLRAKPSAFAVRRAFAAVALSLVAREGKVELWAVNDLRSEVAGALRTGLGQFCGSEKEKLATSVLLPPNSSRLLAVLDELPPENELPTSYAWAQLECGGNSLVEAIQPLSDLRSLLLPCAAPQVEVLQADASMARIRLSSAEFAWYVWLGLPDGVDTSDNAFHLRPRCPREVILTSAGGSLELRSITLSAVNVPKRNLILDTCSRSRVDSVYCHDKEVG